MNAAEDLPVLLGGHAVRPQGPPDWPIPDEDVAEALRAAYRDGSWGKYHGAFVRRLEERLAEYHQVEFALSCGSGTFAVEVALRALRVGPGDEVLLAAYDYGGNFLSVHAVGARPVLVDVDPDNWNLRPANLEPAIGPATRVVLASHLHGGVVPMTDVMATAAGHGLRVIEDAAQMPGATVQGRRAGTWGDVGILSFGGSKLLTAGRGGALLTRHADVHQRARVVLNRGNQLCPLSELQAAVLLPQLAKLDARNRQRADNVRQLVERLQDLPGLRAFRSSTEATHPGYYKLGWQFAPEHFGGLARAQFIAAARAEGIALDEGFRALHVGRSPDRYRSVQELAEAEKAHRGTVVLHHPVLLGSAAEVEEIVSAIRKLHTHAGPLQMAPGGSRKHD